MAMPAGNAVDVTGFVLVELVMADEPVQFRTPIGPSAILIAGIPRRATGLLSIQPLPLSISAFSSGVMRLSRSSTRCSTGALEFLYSGGAESPFWLRATGATLQPKASTAAAGRAQAIFLDIHTSASETSSVTQSAFPYEPRRVSQAPSCGRGCPRLHAAGTRPGRLQALRARASKPGP